MMNLLDKMKYVISGEEGQLTQNIGVWLITVSLITLLLIIFKDEVSTFINSILEK